MIGHSWNTDEITILRSLYEEGLSYSEICRRLPGRSKDACQAKLRSLGVHLNRITLRNRKWTQDEDSILCELWGTTSTHNIAERLAKTRNSVIGRAYRRGLCKSTTRVRTFYQRIEALHASFEEAIRAATKS